MFCRVGWQEWRQHLLNKRGLFYFLSVGKGTISLEAARKSKENMRKRQGKHRHLASPQWQVCGRVQWVAALSILDLEYSSSIKPGRQDFLWQGARCFHLLCEDKKKKKMLGEHFHSSVSCSEGQLHIFKNDEEGCNNFYLTVAVTFSFSVEELKVSSGSSPCFIQTGL